MTLKHILLGTIAGAFATTGAIAADLPAGSTEPAEYVRVCNSGGHTGIELPGTDVCAKFHGMARTQYQFAKAGSDDPAGALKARAQFGIDARRDTGFGTAKAVITARGDFGSDGTNSVSISDAKASLGGLQVGSIGSAGNVTYGGKAGNFIHGIYHTDNSGAGIGYSLGVGFGTSIGISIERPTGGAKLIPDIGAAIELSQGWGSIKVGGGAVSHFAEGKEFASDYNMFTEGENPYGQNEMTVAGFDEPGDLTSFGFYAGGGVDIPIPGLSSTKIGASGFFFSGALSKMSGMSSIQVYDRIPECTMADATAGGHANIAACNTATNAGRPKLAEPKTVDGVTRNHAIAADLTADDFKPESIQMKTLFGSPDGGVNYTIGQPDEPAMGMGHIQEIKQNSGFSANGGLSHSFSSDISLAVNGGFFSASEGDYGMSGFQAGGSFDYSPVAGTTFTIGGEFASRSVSFGGDDGPTKTAFEADAQPFDPSWGATVQISQSF